MLFKKKELANFHLVVIIRIFLTFHNEKFQFPMQRQLYSSEPEKESQTNYKKKTFTDCLLPK